MSALLLVEESVILSKFMKKDFHETHLRNDILDKTFNLAEMFRPLANETEIEEINSKMFYIKLILILYRFSKSFSLILALRASVHFDRYRDGLLMKNFSLD